MTVLRMRDISVRFGGFRALSSVALSVESGEVVMLVGPNGAGKSTLLKVLLGLVRAERGVVEIDGRPVTPDRQFKAGLGYLPEAVAFSENLSGRAVLRFFARARGLPRERVDATLERVGLSESARRSVRVYSRGMRQRLGLAQAIMHEPKLLLLDEPTGGLDQDGLSVLWSVLAEWRDAHRMVLLSAHDLALLERRVDRMCVLQAGKVVAFDAPKALRKLAALPQRVHLELAEHANGRVLELTRALEELGSRVDREGSALRLDVPPGALLEVMGAQARFADAVTGLRVQEPPLDMVYERLLEMHR